MCLFCTVNVLWQGYMQPISYRFRDYIYLHKRMRISSVSKMLLIAICMLVVSSTHAQGESYQYNKRDGSRIIVHAMTGVL